ncbi:MAG: hypothetical protein LBR19_01395, partial [Bifidobacteriaceae bacterium]|nr:hypothetical protein [Bifidobacteriaceae bacterium]
MSLVSRTLKLFGSASLAAALVTTLGGLPAVAGPAAVPEPAVTQVAAAAVDTAQPAGVVAEPVV